MDNETDELTSGSSFRDEPMKQFVDSICNSSGKAWDVKAAVANEVLKEKVRLSRRRQIAECGSVSAVAALMRSD